MDELRAAIATVEQKADISVRRHLGFGEANKRIRHFTGNDGREYIGELNSDNKLHGRGILITLFGYIRIGYFNKGEDAPGNYITISNVKNGDEFHVG